MHDKNKRGSNGRIRGVQRSKAECVMSLILFNIYMADLDRVMEKRGIGGISLGKGRI